MEQWVDRFEIIPFEYPCADCGSILKTTIPFAYEQFRGLIAPKCERCGNNNTPYCVIRDPKYGDLFSSGDKNE